MKVLVVDDEVDVRALFEQRFRKEIREKEMVFAFAHSGQEALDYLSSINRESILRVWAYKMINPCTNEARHFKYDYHAACVEKCLKLLISSYRVLLLTLGNILFGLLFDKPVHVFF
jgi:CheY-like chemotaxis protein